MHFPRVAKLCKWGFYITASDFFLFIEIIYGTEKNKVSHSPSGRSKLGINRIQHRQVLILFPSQLKTNSSKHRTVWLFELILTNLTHKYINAR